MPVRQEQSGLAASTEISFPRSDQPPYRMPRRRKGISSQINWMKP